MPLIISPVKSPGTGPCTTPRGPAAVCTQSSRNQQINGLPATRMQAGGGAGQCLTTGPVNTGFYGWPALRVTRHDGIKGNRK
ncbi:unnamed protein product [Arctogadus glacialis]